MSEVTKEEHLCSPVFVILPHCLFLICLLESIRFGIKRWNEAAFVILYKSRPCMITREQTYCEVYRKRNISVGCN